MLEKANNKNKGGKGALEIADMDIAFDYNGKVMAVKRVDISSINGGARDVIKLGLNQ